MSHRARQLGRCFVHAATLLRLPAAAKAEPRATPALPAYAAGAAASAAHRHALAWMGKVYGAWFEGKHLAKARTPLGRWMVNLDTMRPGAIYGGDRPEGAPAAGSRAGMR